MDIMLDLETMGTEPFAPVIAIGAVRFDAGNAATVPPALVQDTFYQPITLESCLAVGLKPSASTITWWLTHPSVTPEARALFTDARAVPLPNALDAFTDWYNSSEDTLWGNSARFDNGLLAAAYAACGKQVPWLHWNEGCYRTLKNLPAARGIKLVRSGTHHNALDDALSQAHHLCAIVKHLSLYQQSKEN